jgi:hypothetical protein
VNEDKGVGTGIAGALSALYLPMGCMMGLIVGLFWLVIIGLALMCGWIWSLPNPK